MDFYELLSIIAAVICGGLAFFVFVRDRHSLVYRTFALGMIVLAIEEGFNAVSFGAISSADIELWQRVRFVAMAFLPGIWLLFSLSFSRTNYKEYLARWRWVLVASFVIPIATVALSHDQFFRGSPVLHEPSGWVLPLGWSGYLFHVFILIGCLLVLMNLENTFRASSGTIRWQIKFTVLGLAGIFAVRVFTASQAVLFHSVNSSIELFNTVALVASGILIIFSLVRSRLLNVDIHLSEAVLYKSLTFLLAGIYLIIFGILAKVLTYFSDRHPFYIWALFVLLAFLGLTVILLSNEVRQKTKRFIYTHFQRPRYDYRKEWTLFTQRTTSLLNPKDLCGAIAKMVSETFGVPSVTLWLADETKENLVMGGSTALPERTGIGPELIRLTRDQRAPVDIEGPDVKWIDESKQVHLDLSRRAQIRYAVPLFVGNEFQGIITLNERVTKESFSLEDFDLLKTIADQAAGAILNTRMSERLISAKEMEAFQTMSTFFVHDLKNLASRLSLTVQNLPTCFDDAEFRRDASGAISDCVDKMNKMCGGLSLLRQGIVLQPVETDLNELLAKACLTLNGAQSTITQDLKPVPRCLMDPDQIQKVILNLVLNGIEAAGSGGQIRISTEPTDGWVLLSVSDNGRGMSKEFVEKSLFRPFKTTKKHGMGIGLFHSKMIIEAHRGRIEVESVEGKGSVFRVYLPIK